MTHAELVDRAARWLQKDHALVLTEMASAASDEPDAFGFRRGWTTLIECKVSRADYYADRQKYSRRLAKAGVAGSMMGDRRWFLTPAGLLEGLTVTEGWGLLEVHGKVVRQIVEAPLHDAKDHRSEHQLLVSAIRRIGQAAPKGVSVKCYTYETKRRATLGVSVSKEAP